MKFMCVHMLVYRNCMPFNKNSQKRVASFNQRSLWYQPYSWYIFWQGSEDYPMTTPLIPLLGLSDYNRTTVVSVVVRLVGSLLSTRQPIIHRVKVENVMNFFLDRAQWLCLEMDFCQGDETYSRAIQEPSKGVNFKTVGKFVLSHLCFRLDMSCTVVV